MRTRRIAAALLLALLPLVATLPASAQEDPVTVQARARFKEGVHYFDKGQFENARLAFLQAYALKKHPAVLLNLAQSSAKSGHYMEGSKYFQQFLKESTTASEQQKKDAESGLADVRQKLGRIEVIAPAGAEVMLDEKESVGTAPLADAIDVEPGSHSVKTRGSDHSVTVTANAGQKVTAKLVAVAPPPVAVTPTPATTTPTATEPTKDTSARSTGAKRTNLLSPPKTMFPVYIGLGVGVAGAASSILFGLVFKPDAQKDADTVAENIRSSAPPDQVRGICNNTDPTIEPRFRDACRTLKENNDKVDSNALVANVSLVVAGAGFATAILWYLLAPKRDDAKATTSGAASTQLTVTPYGGWGNGGLVLRGGF